MICEITCSHVSLFISVYCYFARYASSLRRDSATSLAWRYIVAFTFGVEVGGVYELAKRKILPQMLNTSFPTSTAGHAFPQLRSDVDDGKQALRCIDWLADEAVRRVDKPLPIESDKLLLCAQIMAIFPNILQQLHFLVRVPLLSDVFEVLGISDSIAVRFIPRTVSM